VPELIERAKRRAEADGLAIDFRVADAQALPYDAATFDCVVSIFGVMFAPDQEKSARELARVTKPGGTIALATWRPDGYGGAFFGPHARAVPPPPGVKPPLRWGTTEGLDELLGPWTKDLRTEIRSVTFFYKTLDHMIEEFEAWFGPSNRVVATVDAAGRAKFEGELRETLAKYNQAKDGTAQIVADYLQVVATRNDRSA
jgi:ubiquinone/menaquinone biosynthesis C-methylase UbiE